MCTILIWKDAHPRWPLIVAANRDEFEGRASSGPRALSRDPLVIGGRDEVAGGTWLAISECGFVVALANRRDAGKHDPARHSRGLLVLDAARAKDLEEARRAVAAVDPAKYNPFVLLGADAQRAFSSASGSDGMAIVDVASGAHAITNWQLDADSTSKAAHALELARATRIWANADADELARHLHAVLRDHAHGKNDLDGGLCVHRPADRYGTRSSWIVLLGAARDDTRAYYIEGHPCTGERSDVTHLLRGNRARGVEV